MTKITIEHIECIEDKPPMNYTLIALNDFYNDIDIDLRDDDIWTLYRCGNYYVLRDCGNDVISHVVLPPLPRNPTADDVELLHAYAAHGLCPEGYVEVYHGTPLEWNRNMHRTFSQILRTLRVCERLPFITHAINKQGERVEVAICDTQ